MLPEAKYPAQPVKAALIAFLVLSAYIGAFMPFDERLRAHSPLVFGFCAFLSVVVIGLMRHGRRVWLLLAAGATVPAVLALIAIAIMGHSEACFHAGGHLLEVALYLQYALCAWGLWQAAKGWWLYFGRA